MIKKIQYQNTIIKGYPSICRVDKNYYLVTSSFEYLLVAMIIAEVA